MDVQFKSHMSALKKQMNDSTAPFPKEEFLTPEGLYVLASLGGNRQTIPGIPFPSDFDAKRGLLELTPAYVDQEVLSDLGREVILAIAWMQQSSIIAMINAVTCFYEKDGLPVTVVTPDETQTKMRIAHRYKTPELLGMLGAFSWMHQKLEKAERFMPQDVQVNAVIEQFDGCEHMHVALYESGKLTYNNLFFDYDGGVVKYDMAENKIEERSGRTWLKELMQKLYVNEEFGFDKRKGF